MFVFILHSSKYLAASCIDALLSSRPVHADMTLQDRCGRTPLHLLCQCRNSGAWPSLQAFIDRRQYTVNGLVAFMFLGKECLYIEDRDGKTPLDIASTHKYTYDEDNTREKMVEAIRRSVYQQSGDDLLAGTYGIH